MMPLLTNPVAGACFGRWLLGLLLVLVSLSAAPADEIGDPGQLRSRALASVNQERMQRGLGRLQLSDDLNEAAQTHVQDLLRHSYFAHASPEGDTVQDRFGFCIIVGDDQALYAVQTFAGPGLPHGLASGEDSVPLPPEQRFVQALQAINRARDRAGVPPLQASPALDQAARTLLPLPGQSDDLALTGDMLGAIPSEQRSRWQRVAAVLDACGGCGTVPTAADLRFFRDQWLDSPQYRATLLNPSATHLGFALITNGEAAKTAMAVMRIGRRPAPLGRRAAGQWRCRQFRQRRDRKEFIS